MENLILLHFLSIYTFTIVSLQLAKGLIKYKCINYKSSEHLYYEEIEQCHAMSDLVLDIIIVKDGYRAKRITQRFNCVENWR